MDAKYDLKLLYKQWYMQEVKAKLTIEQKLSLINRISELRRKKSLCMDEERNYIGQFPELKPFSKTEKISGLQLCVILETIFEELHFPA